MTLSNKKIAVFIPYYVGGGAETVSDIIFSGLIEQGYEVELVSVMMNDRSRIRAKQIGYKVTDLSEFGPNPNTPLAEDAILKALKTSNAQNVVLTVCMPKSPEVFRKELRERNLIFHLHSLPLYEAIAKVEGSRRIAQATGSVWKQVEWYFVKYLKQKLFKCYNYRYKKHYRRLYRNVDHLITLTESYRRELNQIVGHGNDSHVATLYNPFDPQKFAELTDKPKQKELLYVGRISLTDKGVDHLVRSWKKIAKEYPDWKLKIVGDGDDKAYIKWIVGAMSIERVEFHDYTNDPSTHYATASILCLPSNLEGWPTVLMEAMAAGVVPIAFSCSSGVREILDEGRGILVNPGNERKFAEELRKLISNPEELEKRKELYPSFIGQFTPERAVENFKKLLK